MANNKRKPVTKINQLLARRGVPGLLSKHAAKKEYKVTDRELATLTPHIEPHPKDGSPIRLYRELDLARLASTPAVLARLARKAKRQAARSKSEKFRYLNFQVAKERYGLTDAELRTIKTFVGDDALTRRYFAIPALEEFVRNKKRM